MDEDTKKFMIACIVIASFILSIILIFMFIKPIYSVWSSRLTGEAEYAQAEANRKIKILEAKAFQESAKSLAEAEIIRAEGMAKANKIIGDSLQGNESYLKYLWIQGLQTENTQVIYVPTETNLPILEATRNRGK